MKPYAIKENHLYRKTFQRGKRWSGKFVSVYVLKDLAAKKLKKANPQKQYINRIGLSVPKREGGAIERNRVKRIIRAGLQGVERRHPLRRGFLIVIAARPGIEGVKSPAVESELRYIFKKLEMFEPQPQAEEAKAPSAPPKEEAP
jgi:ribonuclease P protein component